MAIGCEELLVADILKDCDNLPMAGLEVNILLFNRSEVDLTGTTFDATNDLLLTNFLLQAGHTGYLLEGIKQSNNAMQELVPKDYSNSWKHTFAGVLLNPTVANRKSLEAILSGGKYIAIVERLWKGPLDADAFVVLGFNSGLVASSDTWNANENDGVEIFELSSLDSFEEPKPYYTLLETDYATTKAAFDNKFAVAVT